MPSSTKLSKTVRPTLGQLTAVSNYRNSEVVKHYGGMTMDIALQSTSPSIGVISREHEEAVRLSITNMMVGTSLYFDTPLQVAQAEIIAEELLGSYDYRQLRLEDVWAICTELKEKEIYKLTPARIVKQIHEYTDRRIARSIQLSQEACEYHKAQTGESNIDKRILGSARQPERSNEIVAKNRVWMQQFK